MSQRKKRSVSRRPCWAKTRSIHGFITGVQTLSRPWRISDISGVPISFLTSHPRPRSHSGETRSRMVNHQMNSLSRKVLRDRSRLRDLRAAKLHDRFQVDVFQGNAGPP